MKNDKIQKTRPGLIIGSFYELIAHIIIVYGVAAIEP